MEKKAKLEGEAMRTKKKINTAKTLINSLAGEKERWQKDQQEINEVKRRLVGNCSLATSFISYCGPFNSEFRHILARENFSEDMRKKGVPFTSNLDLT